jgi:hypothetical protein
MVKTFANYAVRFFQHHFERWRSARQADIWEAYSKPIKTYWGEV